MKPAASLGLALACLVAMGCKDRPRFREGMKLGGQEISAEVLNLGHETYMHYCFACHGERGDGQGPSAPGMRPPPRDFSTGAFKFGGVAAGELPNDDDLVEVVRRGLAGTPMLPWDLGDRERHAVVQYLKTFSERWKSEPPGERVKPDGPDPWVGKEPEAIALGRKLYHLSGVELDPATNQPRHVLAGCNTCHPSYLTAEELGVLSKQVLRKEPELREDPHRPALKESEFAVGDKKVAFLPNDFLFHPMKNGASTAALFRTIAAGIGGTAMPTWKGSVKDEDLWALAHYVRSLAELRDTPAGAALQTRLSHRQR